MQYGAPEVMHTMPTDLKEPSNETNHSHLWTYIGSNFVADDGVDDTVPPQNRNRQRGDCWLYRHRALVHARVFRNPVLSRECREWGDHVRNGIFGGNWHHIDFV